VDDLAPAGAEAERHLADVGQRGSEGALPLGRNEQQEKAAPTGASSLPPSAPAARARS
jgi:hypothetical protein